MLNLSATVLVNGALVVPGTMKAWSAAVVRRTLGVPSLLMWHIIILIGSWFIPGSIAAVGDVASGPAAALSWFLG